MTDSFGWTFGGEWTRDKILADRVAGLESHSARTTSRLRSQLNKVQGNLEKRLDALTAAFDAYVELGDIREQLLAHADTSGSRRQASAAFEALTEGRTAPPMDTLDGQYWLPYAVNALIAVVEGAADTEAEESARRLTPDADRFIVFAAGAIDRGDTVRDRVADLLVGDGHLTSEQSLLWNAAHQGVYGDVLPSIHAVWAATLDDPDPRDWQQWVAEQAGQSPQQQLTWLDEATGRHVPAPVEYLASTDTDGSGDDGGVAAGVAGPPSIAALRDTVTAMIEEGIGEEQELLARARELRARIEDPEGSSRVAATARRRPSVLSGIDKDSADDLGVGPQISAVVRDTWLDAAIGSATREELDGWVRPGLAAAAAAVTLPQPTPAVVTTRTPGGTVDVVAGGPKDPKRVRTATANIVRQHERPQWRHLAFAGGAALGLVLVIICAVTQSTGGVVLFLLGALGSAGAAGWEFIQYRRAQEAIRTDNEALQVALPKARDEAASRDRENHLALEQARAAQESLVARLSAPADD